MPLALGLDASTQSFSAVVIDPDAGKIVAEASVNFGERLPQYHAPNGFITGRQGGEVHADPLMWLDALELLLEDLRGQCDFAQVAAICGAGQQHGSVYLNEDWFARLGKLNADDSLSSQLKHCLARATSPIWMDTSTTEECRKIAEAVGGNHVVCAKSGSVAIERFTGPQIRRFYKRNPGDYEQTARIHLVSSFLCSVLCGADAPVDTGDGAGMNLLNIDDWQWDADLANATAPGLRERLPEVVSGQTQAGEICRFFVEKYGFAAGTPITVFTGDNPSSLVGVGASRPGKVVISLGTSDTFFAAMPRVAADPDGCGHVFGNPMGGSMSLQCFINGSLAREAVKERFGLDWAGFTAALRNTPVGNDGNRMLPFFRPEISPRLDLDEPILRGDNAFVHWDNAEAAVRACVEGQFLNMKLRSAWMNLEPEVIFLTGGASRNDAIAQVMADIFQARVERLATSSSVALGAAMRASENSLGVSLEMLESVFCQPIARGGVEPRKSAGAYAEALDEIAAMVSEQS